MADFEFIQRCVTGDKLAWDEFVDKYSRLIYSYILNILGDKNHNSNVEDVFQEIFLSLVKDNFRKLKSFKGRNGASLSTWLRQVAIRHTLTYLRRRVRHAVSIDVEDEEGNILKDILPDDAVSAQELAIAKEKLKYLKVCIRKLDTDDKFFVELHINQGLSLEELKGVLRVSRGAADMRKHRIVEILKKCFRSKGFALDF